MAQALQAIGQIVFPLPLFARLCAAVGRAVARLGRGPAVSGETPSVPPVSAAWLLEHEIAARKHYDEY